MTGAVDRREAEEALRAHGLRWLADLWEPVPDDGAARARFPEVSPDRVAVKLGDFGDITAAQRTWNLLFPPGAAPRPCFGHMLVNDAPAHPGVDDLARACRCDVRGGNASSAAPARPARRSVKGRQMDQVAHPDGREPAAQRRADLEFDAWRAIKGALEGAAARSRAPERLKDVLDDAFCEMSDEDLEAIRDSPALHELLVVLAEGLEPEHRVHLVEIARAIDA